MPLVRTPPARGATRVWPKPCRRRSGQDGRSGGLVEVRCDNGITHQCEISRRKRSSAKNIASVRLEVDEQDLRRCYRGNGCLPMDEGRGNLRSIVKALDALAPVPGFRAEKPLVGADWALPTQDRFPMGKRNGPTRDDVSARDITYAFAGFQGTREKPEPEKRSLRLNGLSRFLPQMAPHELRLYAEAE